MRSGLSRMELFSRRPCDGIRCLLTRNVERAAGAVVKGIVIPVPGVDGDERAVTDL